MYLKKKPPAPLSHVVHVVHGSSSVRCFSCGANLLPRSLSSTPLGAEAGCVFLREVAGGWGLLVGLILSFSRYNCCYPPAGVPSCNKSDNNYTAGRTCPIGSKFPTIEFHSFHCDVSYETGKYKVLNFSSSFTAGFGLEKTIRGL